MIIRSHSIVRIPTTSCMIVLSLALTACAGNGDKEYFLALDNSTALRAKARAYPAITSTNFTGKSSIKANPMVIANSSLSTNTAIPAKTTSMANKVQQRTAREDIEEYVSRIGKRILIVIDNHTKSYDFVVSNSLTPALQLDRSGKIQISLGLLNMLEDEAELAAVLSQKIVTLQNTELYLNAKASESQALEIDKYGMIYMSRAGYDPKAAVELQELSLNPNNPRHGNWLTVVYADNQPTVARLATNKAVSSKLPSGLQRGKDRYSKNLGKS